MDQAAIIPRATPTVNNDRRITFSFCRSLQFAKADGILQEEQRQLPLNRDCAF
jgi:hypothetical protein